MGPRLLIFLAGCVCLASPGCSRGREEEASRALARELADGHTRDRAVAEIVAAPGGRLPLLLSWTERPPARVDQCQLYCALADIFGQLKSKEAIPFLIRNVSALRRGCIVDLNPWMKSPEVIEYTFPALKSLINIGPEAGKELIQAAEGALNPSDRRAVIFAVSQIKLFPEKQQFLLSMLHQAEQDRIWAQYGLDHLKD